MGSSGFLFVFLQHAVKREAELFESRRFRDPRSNTECDPIHAFALARCKSERKMRPNRAQGLRNIETRHHRHRHVDNNGVEFVRIGMERLQCGNRMRITRAAISQSLQSPLDGFGETPQVINGFSDLIVEVFGESIGKHARSAVGIAALPGNSPVEVEMILEGE